MIATCKCGQGTETTKHIPRYLVLLAESCTLDDLHEINDITNCVEKWENKMMMVVIKWFNKLAHPNIILF